MWALLALAFGIHPQRPNSLHSPSPPSSCAHLPGTWTGLFLPDKFTGDIYDLEFRGDLEPGHFNAVYVSGKSPSWSLGRGFIDPSTNATVTISFDSGVSLSGTVSDNCATLTFDNNSQWRKVPREQQFVHLVFMNHLDVGYNGIPAIGLVNNILNRYFTIFFPRAIAMANAMRDLNSTDRFIYTTHSWLLDLYLRCPNLTLADIPLQCPSSEEITEMENAIKRGDIAFHAAPMNMQYGNALNGEMVDLMFGISRDLADRLGVPRPTVASLRDVPGSVRSLIPILARNNITALSIGVNNYSPAPQLFNQSAIYPGTWIDPNTGKSTVLMQTGQGIGYPNNVGPNPNDPQGLSRDSCVMWPGFAHVLCWAFRTDNSGPPESVDEILNSFNIARWQFPGAVVMASTFDNFNSHLQKIKEQFPTSTKESGETWLTGVPSDPWKMIFYREASRLLLECVHGHQCVLSDLRVKDFVRMLIKIPEHTWGMPTIYDKANYTNAQFRAARQAQLQFPQQCNPATETDLARCTFLNSEASWLEQRDIAAREGMRYLADHPLASTIQSRMEELTPRALDLSTSTVVPPNEWTKEITVALADSTNVAISLDGETGAISQLIMNGVSWADESRLLGQFRYQTYNSTDYDFQNSVPGCCCCYGWENQQTSANPQQQVAVPKMTGMWVSSTTSVAPFSILVSMAMDTDLVENYGAPEQIWANITITTSGDVLIDLQLFNKTSTRLGEALYYDFTVVPQNGYRWMVDVLGGWTDPLDVVSRGSQHQHGINRGVQYMSPSGDGFLAVDMPDTPVVSPHTATDPATTLIVPFDPLTGPVLGISAVLFQNAYNTNYPLYSLDPAYRYRFALRTN